MPRRSAPRNDMQRLVACPHLQAPCSAAPRHYPLAPVHACPPSACHCKPVSFARAHVPAFSMSLRTPSLHPRTPARFLHVIASQCAHWCGNPRLRRETLQIGNPQGKSVALFRIRLRCCFLLCATAGEADCHVAPLLAIITCFHTTINENVIYWRYGRSSMSYSPRD